MVSEKFHKSVFSPPTTTLLILRVAEPASERRYLLEVATGTATTVRSYSPTPIAATVAASIVKVHSVCSTVAPRQVTS